MDKEGFPTKVPSGAVMTDAMHVDTDRLIGDHKDLVYHLIHRTVRDRTAYEEIFQEVFLNVLESLPRFEGRSKLSTWIASIAIHTCYKFIHKAGKQERVESFGDWLERGSDPAVPSDLQENLEGTTSGGDWNGISGSSPPSTRCPSPSSIWRG
jgi:DNA-directed RNA polymerase specialized sigma24 family protein